MTVYSKFNVIYRLQKWLDSVPGQTFLNYAYSWGASIVILGTLFKLTHLPGANAMLYMGMGTEVIVFFISAFDRPFDKTAIGKDLPVHAEEDGGVQPAEALAVEPGGTVAGGAAPQQGAVAASVAAATGGGGAMAGGTIIVGGGAVRPGGVAAVPSDGVAAAGAPAEAGGGAAAGGGEPVVWLQQQQQVTPEMEEATSNYVDELNKLTEMLGKVADQSQRLTRDSEEMENLNRTLTGICKVYEMQLKGASAQIGTIDQINEQSRKMADQIAELNRIYARMIEAMTANMKN